MFRILLLTSLLWTPIVAAAAKPLLLDSQDTYVTACLDWDDTPERLVQICRKALDTSGVSERQRVETISVLVWSLDDSGEEAEALEAARAATRDFPEYASPWENLAWLEYGRDNLDNAKEYFETAKNLGLTASGLAGLAATLYRLDEIDADSSIEMLDAAVAMDPDYEWALREKGYTLGGIGRYAEAVVSFETALALNDRSFHNLYGMLWSLSEADRWEEALPYANEVLSIDPDHFNGLSRRSLVYLFLNRPKLALKDAERLLELRPGSSDAIVRKARALFELGQREHAISELIIWAEGNDPYPYVDYWVAELYYQDGRSRRALEYIERAVALEPDDYYNLKLRGFVALDLGDLETAASDAARIVEKRPQDPWALNLLAHVEIAQGALDDAFETIARADSLELPRDQVEYFVDALVERGSYMKAIKLRALYPE